MPTASDGCRSLNEQNFLPFCDHGDDGVKHEFDRFVRARFFLYLWPKRGKRHHTKPS
jgi:hypothetical protein